MILLGLWGALFQSAGAAPQDGEPHWQIGELNDTTQVLAHLRETDPDSPEGIDVLRIEAQQMTLVEAVTEVERAAVIDELGVQVEVHALRSSIQVLARAVFPRTRDASGKPTTAWIYGPVIESRDRWQKLALNDLPLEVRRAARRLRARFRREIDTTETYIDRVVLRIRPPRGTDTIRIRGPQLAGFVSRQVNLPMVDPQVRPVEGTSEELPIPGGARGRFPVASSRFHWDGQIARIDGRPIYPRMVTWRGEPFADLVRRGFNIAFVPKEVTTEQLAEARAAGIWLIAAPPGWEELHAGVPLSMDDQIIGWYLGDNWTSSRIDLLRRWVATLRQQDPISGRIIVAGGASALREVSRLVDVVLHEPTIPANYESLTTMMREIGSANNQILPGKVLWVALPTAPPNSLQRQVAAFLQPAARRSLRLEFPPDQLSRFTWLTISSGARGLLFSTPAQLPTSSINSQAQDAELTMLLRHLVVFEPLLATGRQGQAITTGTQTQHLGHLAAGRSHLLFVTLVGERDGMIPPRTAKSPQSIVIPAVAEPTDAILFEPSGPTRLPFRRVAGGVRITLPAFTSCGIVVLTQDAALVARLYQQLRDEQADQLQRQGILLAATAQQLRPLAVASHVDAEERSALESGLLAAEHTSRAWERLAFAAEPGFLQQLRQTQERLSNLRAQWAERMSLNPLHSHPLSLFPETWPQMLSYLNEEPLVSSRPLIEGGEMEDVGVLESHGWTHQQKPTSAGMLISLASYEPREGNRCLQFASANDQTIRDGSREVAPQAWIATPRVDLAAQAVVRISGWVRAQPATAQEELKLLVADTLAGPDLAERLPTNGDWQRFEIMRTAPERATLRVDFAAIGNGTLWLDDIRIEELAFAQGQRISARR